jgi:hypothetical protein
VSALGEALSSPIFLGSVRLGAIAALVGGVGCWIWRTRLGRPASVVGLLLISTALLSLSDLGPLPIGLVIGLVLLGGAGIAGTLIHSLSIGALLALPGAWMVLETVPDIYSGWGRFALTASIASAGSLTAASDRQLSSPVLGPLMLAIGLAGVYLDVPDTEVMLVLVGVMAPLVLLGAPAGLSRLGAAGSYMATGLMVWASALGGVGRLGSVVGAVACFGVLLLVPIVVPESAPDFWNRRWPALIGIHLLVVGVSSRVAGFRTRPLQAGVIAAAALFVGAWLLTRIPPDDRSASFRREPHDPTEASPGGSSSG